MAKFSIIGGGSWGTAIAQLLARNNHQVLIYVRGQKVRESINQENLNKRYFPEFKLDQKIKATDDLEETVNFSKVIILSVPTPVTREIMSLIKPYLTSSEILISTAKGIEEGSFLRNSEIIKEFCDNSILVVSSPTHAEEVIRGLPSAAVIASENEKLAGKVQEQFMSPDFRFYINTDIVGVELGGAMKNIMAVASGISDGLDYGDNSRAALITRGLRELTRFGVKLGGRPLTFSGLAGMGDLVVTCTSMHSRNRRFGIKIGEGETFADALQMIGQVVEGVKTTKAVFQLIHQGNLNLELPITEQVYRVLFQDKEPLAAVNDLMLRDPKQEIVKLF